MTFLVLGDAGSAASADPVVTTAHGPVPLRHLVPGALVRTGFDELTQGARITARRDPPTITAR